MRILHHALNNSTYRIAFVVVLLAMTACNTIGGPAKSAGDLETEGYTIVDLQELRQSLALKEWVGFRFSTMKDDGFYMDIHGDARYAAPSNITYFSYAKITQPDSVCFSGRGSWEGACLSVYERDGENYCVYKFDNQAEETGRWCKVERFTPPT